VTVRLKDMTLGQSLAMILDSIAENGKARLTFMARGDRITISPAPGPNAAAAAAVIEDAEGDKASREALQKPVQDVTFEAVSLTDVIDFMRDISSANIYVNWKALEAAGVARNAPVSARLRGDTLEKSFDKILDNAAGGKVRLGPAVGGGVITIDVVK
jgi:hypothetical protein